MKIKGTISYWLLNEHGKFISYESKSNLVVDNSRLLMANLIRESPLSSPIRAIAIGTSSVAPAVGQTALQAEVFRKLIPVAGTDSPTAANKINTAGVVVVTISQMLSPFAASDGIPSVGLVPPVTIREFGLFGDIVEITNPASSLVVGNFTASGPGAGAVTPAVYNVTYTFVNNNGETTSPAAYAYTLSGPNDKFIVALPAAPTNVTRINLYINGFLYGYTTLNLTTNPFVEVTTNPPGSGQTPPSVNTSLIPGILNSGTMLNRALIGPVTMNAGNRIILESVLVFG